MVWLIGLLQMQMDVTRLSGPIDTIHHSSGPNPPPARPRAMWSGALA
jgi:hypothetical protein